MKPKVHRNARSETKGAHLHNKGVDSFLKPGGLHNVFELSVRPDGAEELSEGIESPNALQNSNPASNRSRSQTTFSRRGR